MHSGAANVPQSPTARAMGGVMEGWIGNWDKGRLSADASIYLGQGLSRRRWCSSAGSERRRGL